MDSGLADSVPGCAPGAPCALLGWSAAARWNYAPPRTSSYIANGPRGWLTGRGQTHLVSRRQSGWLVGSPEVQSGDWLLNVLAIWAPGWLSLVSCSGWQGPGIAPRGLRVVARPRDDPSLSLLRVLACRDRLAVARRHQDVQLRQMVLHIIYLFRISRHQNCQCLKCGHKAVPGRIDTTTGTPDAASRFTIPAGRRVRARRGRVRAVGIRHRKAIKQLKQGF